jgi:predicted ferric reductase
MTSQVFWHVARASGLVAWALAAGAVLWGLALSTHALGRRPRPAWLFDLHRFLGGLALVFTGVHVLAVVADSYVHFTLVDVLVPLAASWHPLAVAWGVVGLYLLLAVELTSLARTHLPRALWRRVHYAGFGLFVVTTVHGLSAGTDRRSPAFLLAVVVACGLVALLTAVRLRKIPVASGHRVVQAEAVGGGGRLGAAVDAQLGEDVADVDAGRLAADEQRLGDLAVGAARRHQA